MMATDDLDDLLALARGQAPAPSEALMARILADAEAIRLGRRPVAVPRPRRGWLAALGGWPALGTLVASSLLGVSIGVAQPSSLSSVTGAVLGEAVTVSTGLDVDLLSLWEG